MRGQFAAGRASLSTVLALGLGLGVSGAGCNGWDLAPPPPASITTDSLGIPVITHSARAPGPDSIWWIEEEPALTVGLDEAGGVWFGRVADARLGPDGSLAVVDGTSFEITVVDSTGTLVGKIGRQGEGPGEFARSPGLAWSPDGTLLTWDPGSMRISRFDVDGALLDERSLGTALQSIIVQNGSWDLAADGTLLGRVTHLGPGDGSEPDRIEVLVIPADSDVPIPVGEYEGVVRVSESNWLVSSRFPHRTPVALSPDGRAIWAAESAAWELTRFGVTTGDPEQFVRLATARTPVVEQMIEEERDLWREVAGDRVPASTYLRILDRFPVPDSLPAIYPLRVDPGGNLWAGRRETPRSTPPTQYEVISPTGAWIATVRVPPDLSFFLDISGDAVAIRGYGALDEPVVTVHRIRRR